MALDKASFGSGSRLWLRLPAGPRSALGRVAGGLALSLLAFGGGAQAPMSPVRGLSGIGEQTGLRCEPRPSLLGPHRPARPARELRVPRG